MIKQQNYQLRRHKVKWWMSDQEDPSKGYVISIKKNGYEITEHLRKAPTDEKVESLLGDMAVWIEDCETGEDNELEN